MARAPALQAGGRRFDSDYLHKNQRPSNDGLYFFVEIYLPPVGKPTAPMGTPSHCVRYITLEFLDKGSKDGLVAKFVFYFEKPVVFCYSLRSAQRAGFDLAAARCYSEVCNECVFSLS